MSITTFKENDFVWAKMAGYPYWPAIIREPHQNAPAKTTLNMQWVYFLGTHNYGWIEDNNLKSYEKYKDQYKKKSTEGASLELDAIIENLSKDPNYQIPFATYASKKVSPKKPRKSMGTPSSERKRSMPVNNENQPEIKKKFVPHETAENCINKEPSSAMIENVCTEKSNKSFTLDTKAITPSNKIFGFLAGAIISEGIVKNLIKSGHRIYFYSSSSSLCKSLQGYAHQKEADFTVCNSPEKAVRKADIILSCMDNSKTVNGIINQFQTDSKNDILKGKIYVEMTSIDAETSQILKKLIETKGASYFEAMLQGNKTSAEEAELIVLAAGPRDVFLDCQSCFKSIAKASMLLGEIGTASTVHSIFQMIRGTLLSALVEGFIMAERCSIKLEAFNKIFQMTHLTSDYLKTKANAIVNKKYILPEDVEEPIEQLQHDIAQGLEMSNSHRQPMPLVSNVNEFFKQARRLGCDSQDSACIFRSKY